MKNRMETGRFWSALCILCRPVLLTCILTFTATTAVITEPASASPNDADVPAFFLRFVEAQNAHDVTAVEAMLWDSPDVLWVTRGVEVRGNANISQTLKEYYSGTWHLEPDMSKFRSTALSRDVSQLLVPITFTRGPSGEAPHDDTFLICQTLIQGPEGWRVAAILPVANTQFK
jgi:hypothetical protein